MKHYFTGNVRPENKMTSSFRWANANCFKQVLIFKNELNKYLAFNTLLCVNFFMF